MRDEKQLPELRGVFEAFGFIDPRILPVEKKPDEVLAEILEFRKSHDKLKLSKAAFYTYDLNNMVFSVVILKAMKSLLESNHPDWARNYEITLSVYPAMDNANKLNFYFIPTWIAKGAFRPGMKIDGVVIDFVKYLNLGPNYPTDSELPFYKNEKGYIYDLGSSCP